MEDAISLNLINIEKSKEKQGYIISWPPFEFLFVILREKMIQGHSIVVNTEAPKQDI